MTRFCSRLLIFILLQGVLLCLWTDPRMPREDGFLASTIDKHARAASVPGPRLLLVGGSGTTFGWKSPWLEEALQRRVINLALHAGVGLEFMLHEAAAVAQPGDWIVLSPEYTLFGVGGSDLSFRQVLEYRPASVLHMPLDRAVRVLDAWGASILGGYLRRSTGWGAGSEAEPGEVEGVYWRRAFNACGDYEGHHHSPPLLHTRPAESHHRTPSRILPFSPSIRRCLAQTVAQTRRRGVTVFLTCPPYPAEMFEATRREIESNHAVLEQIPGLVVLDTPASQTLPLTEFYDTRYHLTAAAAERRSRRLVAALQEWQAKSAHSRSGGTP